MKGVFLLTDDIGLEEVEIDGARGLGQQEHPDLERGSPVVVGVVVLLDKVEEVLVGGDGDQSIEILRR